MPTPPENPPPTLPEIKIPTDWKSWAIGILMTAVGTMWARSEKHDAERRKEVVDCNVDKALLVRNCQHSLDSLNGVISDYDKQKYRELKIITDSVTAELTRLRAKGYK